MTNAVDVRDLEFGFQPGRLTLRGISFTVSAGESVGIVGANGAGKSTLLWCLLGLRKARGEIRLFGEKLSRRVLARVGVVFQNPEDMLFMPRLIDDISLPLLNCGADRATAYEKARAALRRAGLEAKEGEPAAHLSLGQRKRAAIAAALVREPELMVLDEPTAELDGRAVRELAESLSSIPGTRLITSHDLGFLQTTCGRLVVLHRGEIVGGGPTTLVLDDRKCLERAELV
jgi:cobalt/nickel transport system ATP-binding protein